MGTRGLCATHFRKWHKSTVEGIGRCEGIHPDPVPLPYTVEDKLFNSIRRIDKETGCWYGPWSPKLRYSSIMLFGVRRIAHRAMYEVVVGPIPEGLELDHLCRNPRCVNPAHLEPVTGEENKRRAAAARTHCKYGHEFSEDNTARSKRGARVCLTCRRARDRDRAGTPQRLKAKRDSYARKVGKL